MSEPPVPDTAMMSGSDDGEPGERLADAELSESDKAVLAELGRSHVPVVQAREESPEMSAAVEDDSVVPRAQAPDRADPLDPVFREPSG